MMKDSEKVSERARECRSGNMQERDHVHGRGYPAPFAPRPNGGAPQGKRSFFPQTRFCGEIVIFTDEKYDFSQIYPHRDLNLLLLSADSANLLRTIP